MKRAGDVWGGFAVMLVLVAVLSGALQTVCGLAGGGRLIKYIPYPLVSGYMSAVGVLIFRSQLPKFLGRLELLQLAGNLLIIGPVGGGGVLAGIGDQWAGLAGLGRRRRPHGAG